MSDLPTVSVIMPVRNERAYIDRSLRSVLEQDYPSDLIEVIVVDGASTDDTATRVMEIARTDRRVRLLRNERRITPVSLNLGLAAAVNEVLIRVDGHCELEPDYIARCVEVLRTTGAACVGGMWETVGETAEARAIAAAQSSRFGVGNVAFRVRRPTAGPADTVPFGAWPRAVFERYGGFDEELVRNQDDEFTFRLTQAGEVVWYDPSIRSRYFSRASLLSLWRQYFQYGRYKVVVARKRGGFAAGRHLVPGAFVAAVGASATWLMIRRSACPLFAVLAPYAAANALVSRRLSDEQRVPATTTAAAFVVLHAAYGTGFWRGVAAEVGRVLGIGRLS